MTLVSVDPAIDPKIQAKLPAGPRPAIRIYTPTACQ
jgi:hypothetical protein